MLSCESRGNPRETLGARMERDQAYFTRRAVEERSAADKCDNLKARQAHQQMAERYEQQAQTEDAR